MANRNISNVNVGTAPNTNTGETLREAFIKLNENFYALYRNGQFLSNVTTSAAVPGYSFENDKDSGLYNPALGVVGVALNGQEFLLMKVTGEITWQGKELTTKEYVDDEISKIGSEGGILGIPIVDALPSSGNFYGRLVHFNLDDQTYIYNNFGEWVLYKDNIIPDGPTGLEIVNELPSEGNWVGRTVLLTTDNFIYINDGGWIKILKLYTPMANGFTSIDIVESLPSSNLFNGRHVIYNDQVYIYNSTTSSWKGLSEYGLGVGGNTISYIQVLETVPTANNFEGRLVLQGNTLALANVLVYTQNAFRPFGNYITANATISADSIYTAALQNYSVTNIKIANTTITENNLGDNSVNTNAIVNLSITAPKLASNSVTSVKIASNAVTAINLSDDAVTAAKLAPNSVIAAKIADGAVTTPAYAGNSIITEKYANVSITTEKLTDNVITTAKVENKSITSGKLADNVLTDLASQITVTAARYRKQDLTKTNIPIINFQYSAAAPAYQWPIQHGTINPNYNLYDNTVTSPTYSGIASWVSLSEVIFKPGTTTGSKYFTVYYESTLVENIGNLTVGFLNEANIQYDYLIMYRMRITEVGAISSGYSPISYQTRIPTWFGPGTAGQNCIGPMYRGTINFGITGISANDYSFKLEATTVRLLPVGSTSGTYNSGHVFTSHYSDITLFRY